MEKVRIAKIDGYIFVMFKTKKGWRYSKRISSGKLLENVDIGQLFGIEMEVQS